MSDRLLVWMSFFVLAGMAILFGLQFASVFNQAPNDQPRLKHNDIRGMAIKRHRLLYTLNFEQQNAVIDFLNASVPIKTIGEGQRQNPTFESLAIYLFADNKTVTLTPIAYLDGNLIYESPEWKTEGYLMDASQGKLKHLLSQTYDP